MNNQRNGIVGQMSCRMQIYYRPHPCLSCLPFAKPHCLWLRGLEGDLGKCTPSTPRGFQHEVRVFKNSLRASHYEEITSQGNNGDQDLMLPYLGSGAEEWRPVFHCKRINTMNTLLWSPEMEMFSSLSPINTGKIRGFWGLKWSKRSWFYLPFSPFPNHL